MVHLLTREHAMIEWQLADPTSRPAAIADAKDFARAVVLGYFQLFEDPHVGFAPAVVCRSFRNANQAITVSGLSISLR